MQALQKLDATAENGLAVSGLVQVLTDQPMREDLLPSCLLISMLRSLAENEATTEETRLSARRPMWLGHCTCCKLCSVAVSTGSVNVHARSAHVAGQSDYR